MGPGSFIATLHQMLGHNKAAAFIGVPAGDKRDCVMCQYEKHPSPERKQAVIDALMGEPE